MKAYTIFFLFSLLSGFSAPVSAQYRESMQLDSLEIYIRNAQDADELIPLSPDDSAYVEPTVEVVIQFSAGNVNNLAQVEISLGTAKGKNDLRNFVLDYTEEKGAGVLTRRNASHAVRGSKVTVVEKVPAGMLNRKICVSVKATDKNRVSSNVLSKELK